MHGIFARELKNEHRGGTSTVEKRRLVAIVDDEKAVCRALGRLVISAGFEWETFPSAEELLRSCSERTPDCLILDLRLPRMNGLELQQQLATGHCRIPIIFVSARDHRRPVDRVFRVARLYFSESPLTMKVWLNPYIQRSSLELRSERRNSSTAKPNVPPAASSSREGS